MVTSTRPDAEREALLREIRLLHRKREPLNITAVKRRNPEILQSAYAMKPYWGWKQALADAGLGYEDINVELWDYCTCLICGHEARKLDAHVRIAHSLTGAEYRQEFPQAEIVCETVRAGQRRFPTDLPHWEPVWSWEYVLDRALERVRQGWELHPAFFIIGSRHCTGMHGISRGHGMR
jgi:hypothetical protein